MPQKPQLGALLQLTPLTLLEIADKRALRDASIGPGDDGLAFPYWFFQYEEDGELIVASPGGTRSRVSPQDVAGIVRTDPIRVLAMPRSVFADRLRLPLAARNGKPDLTNFHPASVLRAQRDRWGHFDYWVRFDEPRFNESDTFIAPLLDEERARIKPLTNRRCMPVRSHTGFSAWSCDAKAKTAQHRDAKHMRALITAALEGNWAKAARLSERDAHT